MMQDFAPNHRGAAVSLAICVLCIGLIVLGTACPVAPATCATDADCIGGQVCNTVTGLCEAAPTVCTSDDDCGDGEVCNTETGDCEVGPTGCTLDDDCAEGEFCDTQTGDCVENVNLYAVTRVDADYENRVHSEASGHTNCTSCHHAEPAAGFADCRSCHSDDPNDANSFKSVAHDLDESGDGCRACHDADWDDCSFCHPALDEL